MNSNVIKLLLGLCVFLLFILLIEYEFFGLSSSQLEKGRSLATKQQQLSIELPQIQLSKKTVEGYLEIVEKPLFIKGRAPIVSIVDDGPIEEMAKIEDLVLVGIYSTEDHLVALLSTPKADKKFIKKLEGDGISGFLLKEIHLDRVILERNGNEQPQMLRKERPRPQKKSKSKAKRKNTKKPLKQKKTKPRS
jgi:hypothetical protein